MGVRADDQLARGSQPFLWEKGMFNAHLPYVKEIHNLMLFRKLSAFQALLRRLNVFVRREVIHYQRNFPVVEHTVKARLFHFADGDRPGDIVRKGKVYICFNQLSGSDRFQPSVMRKNFLRHRHSHV